MSIKKNNLEIWTMSLLAVIFIVVCAIAFGIVISF